MELKYTKPKSSDQLIIDNLLVKHRAGSHAYGTSLPTSDKDFRGIFVGDPVNYLSPFFKLGESSDTSEEDTKFYELGKFFKLCVDQNPNIVETLWVDEQDIVHTTPAYDLLRSNRELLLSSKVAFTFSGYALSQLKRIKGHNKWINNPQPEQPPKQTDFVSLVHNFTSAKMFKINLEDYRVGYRLVPYSSNLYGVYEVGGYETFSNDFTLNTTYDPEENFFTVEGTRRQPLFIVKFNKTEYDTTKDDWNKYWTWKKNRNVARSELEEQFGYDTKHAMHLVRLLRMGEEILQYGVVRVRRPDAEELLAIRSGAWTYDELVAYAEEKETAIREVWYKNTHLPKKVDLHEATKLFMEVLTEAWK